MDSSFREFCRRAEVDFVPVEELITRRIRAGRCAICAMRIDRRCGCIGVYIYKNPIDPKSSFRLQRNEKSTLPYGVVTSVDSFTRHVGVLKFHPMEEEQIGFENIVDFEIAVMGGVDVGDREKRALGEYLDALESSGEIG